MTFQSRHGHYDFGAPILPDRSCEPARPEFDGPGRAPTSAGKVRGYRGAFLSAGAAQRRRQGTAIRVRHGSCISELAREPNTAKKGFCPAAVTSDGRSFCYRRRDLYCTMIDRSAGERIG